MIHVDQSEARALEGADGNAGRVLVEDGAELAEADVLVLSTVDAAGRVKVEPNVLRHLERLPIESGFHPFVFNRPNDSHDGAVAILRLDLAEFDVVDAGGVVPLRAGGAAS